MSRILMLTRCQYAEENIERIIRKLGHEIFCTTSILDMIKYGKSSSEFLKQFHIVLLSETISNKECQEIIGKLEKDQFIIIQLRGEALAKEEQEGKRKEGRQEKRQSISAPERENFLCQHSRIIHSGRQKSYI